MEGDIKMPIAIYREAACTNEPIREIEKKLDLDKVEPIHITSSDAQHLVQDGDYFKEWYEDELRRFYKDR